MTCSKLPTTMIAAGILAVLCGATGTARHGAPTMDLVDAGSIVAADDGDGTTTTRVEYPAVAGVDSPGEEFEGHGPSRRSAPAFRGPSGSGEWRQGVHAGFRRAQQPAAVVHAVDLAQLCRLVL